METRDGNIFWGILAGTAAAVAGAFLWMVVTVATGLQIGIVALAVGFMVGTSVRYAGRGQSPVFGVAGAILTFLSCVTGEMMAQVQLRASLVQGDFFVILRQSDLNDLLRGLAGSSSPITYLIIGIGIYEGYKLSLRRTP